MNKDVILLTVHVSVSELLWVSCYSAGSNRKTQDIEAVCPPDTAATVTTTNNCAPKLNIPPLPPTQNGNLSRKHRSFCSNERQQQQWQRQWWWRWWQPTMAPASTLCHPAIPFTPRQQWVPAGAVQPPGNAPRPAPLYQPQHPSPQQQWRATLTGRPGTCPTKKRKWGF